MAELKDLIVNGLTHLIGDAIYKTHPAGTSDNRIASTEFVYNAIQSIADNDTKNTAGSNASSNKMFLVGVPSQTTGTNGVLSYSNASVFMQNGGINVSTLNGVSVPASPVFTDTKQTVTSTTSIIYISGVTTTSNTAQVGYANASVYIQAGVLNASGAIITNTTVSALRVTTINGVTVGNTPVFTDTKQNIVAGNSKAYLTGVTTTPSASTASLTAVDNASVYMENGFLYSNKEQVLTTASPYNSSTSDWGTVGY